MIHHVSQVKINNQRTCDRTQPNTETNTVRNENEKKNETKRKKKIYDQTSMNPSSILEIPNSIVKSSSKGTTTVQITNRICSLCREIVKSPTTTPCGHIYCWECLLSLGRASSKRLGNSWQMTCPSCRHKFQLRQIRVIYRY
jgi:late competence protein required for DNA uptake (superfamily II DNA/RNA helicase)